MEANAAEVDGTTALHRDAVETVDLLLGAGADVAAANRYGVVPLSLACLNGSAAIVETLLDAGADPNATQPGGETALMTAARTGVVEPVRLLLATGADANATESMKGQTALMWAAAENHAATIDALVEAGADSNTRLDQALFQDVRSRLGPDQRRFGTPEGRSLASRPSGRERPGGHTETDDRQDRHQAPGTRHQAPSPADPSPAITRRTAVRAVCPDRAVPCCRPGGPPERRTCPACSPRDSSSAS